MRPSADPRRPATLRAGDRRDLAYHEPDFERVCRMIHARAGISLGPHKQNMVYSRLARHVRASGCARFEDYLDIVDSDRGDQAQRFINALTTNLTSFFREPHHFQTLVEHLRGLGRAPLTLWCCAASTGEEPYSLAIAACEAFGSAAPPVTILATDIDTHVLEVAARGVYPVERVESLPDPHRRHFLRGTGANAGMAMVKPGLRALIEFRPLNLLAGHYGLEPGFAAVFCRNVMIYFDKPTQYAVLKKICPLLADDGLLFAGHSESFGHAQDIVRPCGRTVYRKVAAE